MKKSAGILAFKRVNNEIFVFLVHPGGPFWKNKDLGSWSIPKGEFTDEDPLVAATREFEEETGIKLSGDFVELLPVKLPSNKLIYAWAIDQDLDSHSITSNTFEIEWPPRSGKRQQFPEVDRGAWFPADEARQRINPAQAQFILQLLELAS